MSPCSCCASWGRSGSLARPPAAASTLPMPEQEIVIDGERWPLEFRQLLPVERWNAQISLLCGFGAASLDALRRSRAAAHPAAADPRDVKRLHRTARASDRLAAALRYPDFIRTLDPAGPPHAAMVVACTRLLRGSGYVAFDGEAPAHPGTPRSPRIRPCDCPAAPPRRPLHRRGLRRALRGRPSTRWVRDGLPELPETMRESGRRANRYEQAVADLVEAGVLQHRVGQTFEAAVIEVDARDARRGDVTDRGARHRGRRARRRAVVAW